MFNTCSWGPSHRSLTDTDESYNLGGVGFPLYNPRHSQSMVLHFPPKGSVRSPVYKISPTIPKFRFKESMATTWYSDYSDIYCNLHLHLATAIDLSLTIGLTRQSRKVNLSNYASTQLLQLNVQSKFIINI
jgi:hypothetical protein